MRRAIVLLAALLAAAPAAADLAAGTAAFDEGRYLDAIDLLRPEAEQGVAEAQYRLGLIFAKGLGVPPNSRRAVEWLSQAAERGHYQAALDLGNMYKNGDGVGQNEEQAARWLGLAEKIANERKQADSAPAGDCQ